MNPDSGFFYDWRRDLLGFIGKALPSLTHPARNEIPWNLY